jgi:hypothetical protein
VTLYNVKEILANPSRFSGRIVSEEMDDNDKGDKTEIGYLHRKLL